MRPKPKLFEELLEPAPEGTGARDHEMDTRDPVDDTTGRLDEDIVALLLAQPADRADQDARTPNPEVNADAHRRRVISRRWAPVTLCRYATGALPGKGGLKKGWRVAHG